MLLILAIYISNLIIVFALGSLVQHKIFNDDSHTAQFLFFNGLFAYMILIWIVLYFYKFDWILQIIMLVFSIFYLFKQPKYIKLFIEKFSHFPSIYKIVFVTVSLVVLSLSAAYSGLPDNESYYIQTIKWANEQGLVRGLINIHPFLGQFSGWHILQSGFNYHHLLFQWTFNDLNGLFFLIFWFYWLWLYQEKLTNTAYWLTLLPVVSVLLVFFIDSPSPDLPVVLLSLIIFDLFIRYYNKMTPSLLLQLFFLAIFSFLIKPTAVVNLFLVAILIWKHKHFIKKYWFAGLTVLSLILWLSKNYLITGYGFYPFTYFGYLIQPVWQYPRELMQYMSQLGQREGMALSLDQNIIAGFWQWLHQTGWHQVVNSLFVLMLFIFPLVLFFKKKSFQNIEAYVIIYVLGLFYFILILFINPNFRFFLAFLLFFILAIKSQEKLHRFYDFFNAVGIILFIIVALLLAKKHHFKAKNMLIPKPVSKLTYRFKSGQDDHFEYHYPDNSTLFWETGDAPLPAVHDNQIQYFKEHFDMVPQKQTGKKNAYYTKR